MKRITMKVFDCFTFFNEEELLRIRLEELSDVVDRFVLVEANQTFTGKQKPFYSSQLGSWFDEWLSNRRVIVSRVHFPQRDLTPWHREEFQRNALALAWINLAGLDDLVIFSDVDEIPRPSVIETLKNNAQSIDVVALDVTQYFWNFNWQVPSHCNQGGRPIVARVGSMVNVMADGSFKVTQEPHDLRANTKARIPNAGWHFSFLGEYDRIIHKIESFAHTEYDNEEYKDAQRIIERIHNGIDPFDRFPLKWSEIDSTYPKCIQEKRYK